MSSSELEDKLIYLLEVFDRICRKNEIDYCLHGGSVIGAVRHRGVIPWDDDVDVAITYKNWLRFKQAFEGECIENVILVDPLDDTYYPFTYPQLKLISTTVLYKSGLLNDQNGLSLDIMILDPVPNDENIIKEHVENLVILSELRCRHYVINRNLNLKKYFFYKSMCKVVGKKRVFDYLTQKLIYDEENYDGYIQRVGVYPVYWDKKYFDTQVDFNMFGIKLALPNYTYEYLRYTYGDSWMKFPDIIDRAGHGFEWNLEIPFENVKKNYIEKIDKEKYENCWECYKLWRVLAIDPENNVRRMKAERKVAFYSATIKNKLPDDNTILSMFRNNQFSQLKQLLKEFIDTQLGVDCRTDNLLLSVSGTVFYVAMMTLIFSGEYYRADKLLKIIEYNNYNLPNVDEVRQLIDDSRELSIAIYEGNCDWIKIKNLTESVLTRYPFHIDFICAYLNLEIRNATTDEQLLKLSNQCNDYLRLYPDNFDLLFISGNVFFSNGNEAVAISMWYQVYKYSNDGMLVLKAKEILRKLGVSLDDREWYEDDLDVKTNEKMQLVQEKILNLLVEFDNICRQNNLKYFLGGPLAYQGLINNGFLPGWCSSFVVMQASDRERIINALGNINSQEREIESFENSENYPDFSIRYCDISTSLLDLRASGFYKNNSIDLTIYFTMPLSKNSLNNKLSLFFNAIVEAMAFPKFYYNTTMKKSLAGAVGAIMSFVFGVKRTKNLLWKFVSRTESAADKFYIKSYWNKPVFLSSINFSKYSNVGFEGHLFPVPDACEAFVKAQINTQKPSGRVLIGNLLVNPVLPSYVVADELREVNDNIDLFRFEKILNNINLRCSKCVKYASVDAWQIAQEALKSAIEEKNQ